LAHDITILIPVFNDWEAMGLLLSRLDLELTPAAGGMYVLLVDDGSTRPSRPDFPARSSLESDASIFCT